MEKSDAGRAVNALLHACEEIDSLLSKRGLPSPNVLKHWNDELFKCYRTASDEVLKLEAYLRDKQLAATT